MEDRRRKYNRIGGNDHRSQFHADSLYEQGSIKIRIYRKDHGQLIGQCSWSFLRLSEFLLGELFRGYTFVFVKGLDKITFIAEAT